MDKLWKSCLLYTSYDISSNFLHAVTFSYVLHLDVIRRQINKYGYNAEPPIAIPVYAVLPYSVIMITSPVLVSVKTCKV